MIILMGNGIRVKHNHVLQNLNRKRAKSGDKYGKAMTWYLELLDREQKEGSTKWIIKTKQKAQARLDKYGITKTMLINFAESKGKKDLITK